MVQHVDPKDVNFEMDIFWIVFAFQDSVKLLRSIPAAFP
jgi:hypothetical protein